MKAAARLRSGVRIRTGLWAGGVAGFLTGLCYLILFGGLDFSRGNPLAALAAVPSRTAALVAGLTIAGALLGILVSYWTPDE